MNGSASMLMVSKTCPFVPHMHIYVRIQTQHCISKQVAATAHHAHMDLGSLASFDGCHSSHHARGVARGPNHFNLMDLLTQPCIITILSLCTDIHMLRCVITISPILQNNARYRPESVLWDRKSCLCAFCADIHILCSSTISEGKSSMRSTEHMV